MTQLNRKFIILALLVILLAVGGLIFWKLRQSEQTDLVNNMNANFQVSSVSGYSVITSTTYHFTFKIDQKVKYTVGRAAKPMFFEAGFSLPNPDSGEKPNRDTPNKFNLSPVNSFEFFVYPNTNHITSDDLTSFRAWGDEVLTDQIGDTINVVSIADADYLTSIQADGIESFAVYYYLIGKDYIYVFRTNDFTDVQMREFLAGFSVQP